MVSYDDPILISYTWNAQAFGAATITKKIQGPKGRKGRVFDMDVLPTTTFAGTAAAFIQVGVSGTLGALVASTATTGLTMGTTAAGTRISKTVIEAAYVRSGSNWAFSAADTEVLITMSAAVGGSPAGAADVNLTMAWW